VKRSLRDLFDDLFKGGVEGGTTNPYNPLCSEEFLSDKRALANVSGMQTLRPVFAPSFHSKMQREEEEEQEEEEKQEEQGEEEEEEEKEEEEESTKEKAKRIFSHLTRWVSARFFFL